MEYFLSELRKEFIGTIEINKYGTKGEYIVTFYSRGLYIDIKITENDFESPHNVLTMVKMNILNCYFYSG